MTDLGLLFVCIGALVVCAGQGEKEKGTPADALFQDIFMKRLANDKLFNFAELVVGDADKVGTL